MSCNALNQSKAKIYIIILEKMQQKSIKFSLFVI